MEAIEDYSHVDFDDRADRAAQNDQPKSQANQNNQPNKDGRFDQATKVVNNRLQSKYE